MVSICLRKDSRTYGGKMLKKFKPNYDGKDFVVGDIHGKYNLLMDSLKEVSFNFETDRLFSVGDVIDRGEESEQCLDLFYEPWFNAVRGNHEQMMFDGLLRDDKPALNMWICNGGQWIVDADIEKVKDTCYDLDVSLPYGIEVELTCGNTVGIVHAETYLKDWDYNFYGMSYAQSLIWGRSKINSKDQSVIRGIDHIYVGHTPVNESVTLGNVTYIDLGSWYSNKQFKIVEINSFKA